MKRLLIGVICAVCLTGSAMGQSVPNFGSRTGGLGNAGGFATGSGLSNGSTGSLYFDRSAGFAFGNSGAWSNGGNAIYNYGVGGGNLYLGNSNLGPLNTVGPVVPGLGLGTNGLGGSDLSGMLTNGMGLNAAGLYGGGLGLNGGLPAMDAAALGYGIPGLNYGVPGVGLPTAGYGMPGIGYGVPGIGYGLPATSYGVPGPIVPDAAVAGTSVRKPRPESFTNNPPQNPVEAFSVGAPVVTANALRIQDRVARSGSRGNFRNVKVLMAGRTVVLQGSVETQADEQLVQRLVSLEPGVDGVISQLAYPGKAQTAAVTPR